MTRPKKAKLRRQQEKPPAVGSRVARWWAAGAAAILAVLAAIVAVAFLRSEQSSRTEAASELGPVHVHGLGINPADGTLYIATHTGMWRLPRGLRTPKPVGDSRQDTMGFTVTGPNRFLGSGHPDNFDQPPLLGLIESRDGGATWTSISLLGEADFHVLRAVGNRVYGYDVSHARLMLSRDGGKTWVERRPKVEVLDVVADPSAPDRLLATTEAGLLRSPDGGTTWTKLGSAVGLLGWPAPKRLYLLTSRGEMLTSTNGGRSWRRAGTIGGQPAAFLAQGPHELYAATHRGDIVRSRDGGRSWQSLSS